MSEIPAAAVALAGASGLLLGLLYFATLWWTVRRMPTTRRPGMLLAGSFLLRAGVAAVGIVLASGGRPLPLLAAIAGFLLGRTMLIRRVRAPLATAGGISHGIGAGKVCQGTTTLTPPVAPAGSEAPAGSLGGPDSR